MNSEIYKTVIAHKTEGKNTYFEISPKSLISFFKSSPYLKIPDYQRPYSWTESNISQLLKDIQNAVNEDKGWFMGPIFTTHNVSGEVNEKEILDGQQRITTIQLLLREARLIRYSYKTPLALNEQDQFNLGLLENRLEECLINTTSTGYEAKFNSDIAVRTKLQDYIKSVKTIHDFNTWKENYNKFQSQLDDEDLNWSQTVQTIKLAVKEIRSYLTKMIGSNVDEFDPEGFNNFLNYINKVLNDFWLIEIPLRKEDFILDIFESINNRGKSLTLVDIIRFKSLIIANEGALETVRLKWQEIFKRMQQLSDLGAIKDDDDFFKVVLNTYSSRSNGLTQKQLFISEFEERFNTNEGIIEFLNNVSDISNFLISIYTPVDSSNKLLSLVKSHQKKRCQAVLQLVRFALKCSDNARFLVCYLGRNKSLKNENVDLIFRFLYDICRAELYYDVYEGTKSNDVRKTYLEIIQKIEDKEDEVIYTNFIDFYEWDKIDDSTYYFNLLHTTNSDYANLILAFYQFHQNLEVFSTGSDSIYKELTCEHLVPVKWMENWKEFEYTIEDLNKTYSNLKKEKLFSTFEVHELTNRLELLSNKILLKKYHENDKKKLIQDHTLIQFIGNKWVITGPTNSSLGNNSFNDKITKAKRDFSNRVFMPSHSDDLGLDSYKVFNHDSIIQRSFSILEKVISSHTKDWLGE